MFELTATPIDVPALLARLQRPEAGALTIFEGRVRNHHLGRPVTHLDYEAFDDLALAEGQAILEEAEQLHPGAKVLCVHRTGTLQIGAIAVWIGVTSAHRQTGFAACRHVIEELKRRLPIWKKEHHPDGAAEWVNCTAEATARSGGTDYYARQIALPEVGRAGQERLQAARVLVVGLGGLGCPAALGLAGAGVGKLTLVDSGKVELSNLHRQMLFTAAEVGAPKALAAAARLRLHNPAIEIAAHALDFSAANARPLVAGHDIVLDCSDNFATRFLVHDSCQELEVPLVTAAVHRFEGTLDVFRGARSGCLHCQFPEQDPATLDTVGGCAGAHVFAPAVSLLGTLHASEALKLLLGVSLDASTPTLLVNLLDNSLLAIERPPRAGCPWCEKIASRSSRSDSSARALPLFVEAERLAAIPAPQLIYLLDPGETPPSATAGLPVPLHALDRLRELARAQPLVLTCRHGLRSAALARQLRSEGFAVQALTTAHPSHA